MVGNKKVLVVEDDTHLAHALQDKLSRHGFTVIQAQDGREGLKLATMQHPDLILLDIVMPKLDGFGVLKELKKDDWGEKAKVIVLSNYGDSSKIIHALEEHVTDYLVKSDWSLNSITDLIEQTLGTKK